jgi:hypothetical protein
MQTKCCSGCKQQKSISEFNKKGKNRLQSLCKPCNSAYCKAHYKKNPHVTFARNKRRKAQIKPAIRKKIREHLSNGCIDCGEKDLIVLEFDHVADKKYSIGYMLRSTFSVEAVEKEIAKCVVRCANCHRRKTAKDFNWWRANIGE